MKRSLNLREKRLLALCLITLLLVGNALLAREFMSRYKTVNGSLATLKEQDISNRIWMKESALYAKRLAWLEKNMPFTTSAGKSRGELLEDLRNSALDLGLKVENETALDSLELDHANEVSVSMRIRGDQDTMLRWLLTLQSPEKFTAIKSIELDLDSRSKEKTPQAQCNLTAARWFNKNPPPGAVPPQPAAAPAIENPLAPPIGSPLDGIVPLENS